MSLKNILTSALSSVVLMAVASTAGAAEININIHGASAQGSYWLAMANDFIKAQPGCAGATPVTSKYAPDRKFGIVSATCGGNVYNIRDAAKASFEGPLSLLGDDTYANADGTIGAAQGEKCMSAADHAAIGQPAVSDIGYPGASLAPYYRKGCADGTCATLKCVPIHMGVADVAGESFVQMSNGELQGPATPFGTVPTFRLMSAINTSTLTSHNPFVVPFAFFAHNDIKRCTSNATGAAAAYSNCTANPAQYTSANLDNITRNMAVQLFSGRVTNWSEFGSDFVNLPVTACLRHAGSGTAAALDWAVIRGNGWGGTLLTEENRSDGFYLPTLPFTFFNGSTNDMMACINGQSGAIGYADADKESKVGAGKTYPVTMALAYQGEKASAEGVQKGRYDYFSNQWTYQSSFLNNTAGDPYGVLSYVNSLIAMSADPAKIPASKAAYWSTTPQMVFPKASDKSYPSK